MILLIIEFSPLSALIFCQKGCLNMFTVTCGFYMQLNRILLVKSMNGKCILVFFISDLVVHFTCNGNGQMGMKVCKGRNSSEGSV